MTRSDCGIGIDIDTNRLTNATKEIQKAIEKTPPEIRSSFSASCRRFQSCINILGLEPVTVLVRSVLPER
jgi:hypothetical protein